MGIDLGTATVQIAADYSLLTQGISGAKLLMLGLGAAAAGAAGDALKMMGDFQQANTRLVTSAGESLGNLKMVSDGILQTSVTTATSTDQLESGMYIIESAGYHGAAGLAALQAAAEGAKSENADLSDVANAETTIMTDYADKHISAANAVNDLIATVSRGKTNLQDLSASFSNVLPTANAVGVSLYDVSGAMATMTGEGVPAADAATYLRQTLLALDVPSAASVKTLAEIGLTAAQVSDEMKVSLPGALQLIEDHLLTKFPAGSAAYVEAIKNIAGGSKTIQGILDLTGTHLQTFEQNVAGIATNVKTAGSSIDGFALAQQNFNFQLDQAHQELNVLLIDVGTALMPIVSQFLGQDVLPAIQHFSEWATGTSGLHDTFVTLTDVLGTVISDVETLVGWAGDLFQGFEQGNPVIGLVAAGVASLATAIGLIKIEEWSASWYNWFQQMSQGAGVIANVADKALPELSQALGWTQVQTSTVVTQVAAIGEAATEAEAVTQSTLPGFEEYFTSVSTSASGAGTEVAAIGTDATTTESVVSGAALGMTTAMGLATAGMSLLIGGVLTAAQSLGNELKNVTDRMSADVKQAYDSLGTSAQDSQAKIAAAATYDANQTSTQWKGAGAAIMKSADDAKAQYILDQQQMRDEAIKDAQAADSAWTQASQSMNIVSLLQSAGWTSQEIKDYLAGSGINTVAISGPAPINTPGSHHAAGGTIGPGEVGYVAEPGTGGELVEGLPGGGAYVYSGAQTQAMLGGSGNHGGELHVHNHIYLDSREMTAMLMNRAVKQIRVATGVKL